MGPIWDPSGQPHIWNPWGARLHSPYGWAIWDPYMHVCWEAAAFTPIDPKNACFNWFKLTLNYHNLSRILSFTFMLFCGSFMLFLSCFCYAFACVCLLMPCGNLLGKGWPLGSRLWCLTVKLSLSHWYPGSGVVLDCIDAAPTYIECPWECMAVFREGRSHA